MNLSTFALALAIPVAALSLPACSILGNFGSTSARTSAKVSHFTLSNDSSTPIVEFYIEAANKSTGGKNILDQPLQPKKSRRITIATGTTCVSDLKTVFANGTSRKSENIDVCELGGFAHSN